MVGIDPCPMNREPIETVSEVQNVATCVLRVWNEWMWAWWFAPLLDVFYHQGAVGEERKQEGRQRPAQNVAQLASGLVHKNPQRPLPSKHVVVHALVPARSPLDNESHPSSPFANARRMAQVGGLPYESLRVVGCNPW